jgi:putative Holliday junction resolvase
VRVLGLDFGERRMGLAISDPSATLARPLRVVEREAGSRGDAAAIDRLGGIIDDLAAESDSLDLIVVGRPLHLDGTADEQTARVDVFVVALGRRTSIPIMLQDERLSSHEADDRLSVRHRDWRERKKRLDAAAAAIILQDYLDHRG